MALELKGERVGALEDVSTVVLCTSPVHENSRVERPARLHDCGGKEFVGCSVTTTMETKNSGRG